MKCQYDSRCKKRATHKIASKVGDFIVCPLHVQSAMNNKEVRYIWEINKKGEKANAEIHLVTS